MKTKKVYLPANIRAGYTAKEAANWLTENKAHLAPLRDFKVDVDTFSHGRDVCGNGTAHYKVQLSFTASDGREYNAITIVESGGRREQVGYGRGNEAALVALYKLGFEVDTSSASSDDRLGCAVYPLVNFPPVESK